MPKVFETQVRVLYADTDKMGYVYYGNYAKYFEIGRVEALRSLGISYKKMEEDGIMLPVLNFNINYKTPAKYDDILNIKTTINKIEGVKLSFDYEIFNEQNQLICEAATTLVFTSSSTAKPCKPPKNLIELLNY
jgi:acyl-CoA thioester hydrolase